MKSGNIKIAGIIYIIPYLLLLMLGAWYRYQISGLIFLDTDSEHYLMPPVIKALTGQWHKGERPMQYLFFIYFTLSEYWGVKYTLIAQQLSGVLSAAFLAAAWIVYVRNFKTNKLLWHLMGYIMLGIYISSPLVMYLEEFIGPESACIFVMSGLIFCLAAVFSHRGNNVIRAVFFGLALFINLYLANPMPKWVFAAVFTEILLVYLLVHSLQLSKRARVLALIIPHLAYGLLVLLPERIHKIDVASEDRVYIEYQQMVYTHFDLLAQDKTNFGLTPSLQDSLMHYFKLAQASKPNFLVHFNSDDLMWGPAKDIVYKYYNWHYDSIEKYFIHLNQVLAARYPLGVAREIGKQVYAIYVPNKYIRKQIYGYLDNFHLAYPGDTIVFRRFDYDLKELFNMNTMAVGQSTCKVPPNSHVQHYLLSTKYPATIDAAHDYRARNLPYIFGPFIFAFFYFDHVFLFVMLAFFTLRFCRPAAPGGNLILLLYTLIFIYVLTVGTVHTFDVLRFVITIYPFWLATTFFAAAYTGNYFLEILLPEISAKMFNYKT